MCGISGIVDLSEKPIDPDLVNAMCRAMIRRGPDKGGVRALPHAVLGHRRLAILDLSPNGNQPMSSASGELWVVHNGEIYNHKELRTALGSKGFTYFSNTDTESLLYGYKTWKTDLSLRCRGMWAFAIWDRREKTLYLSRDRFGEKPLYYYIDGSRLAFSSTLAGLSPVLERRVIDPAAVASLLAYEYIPNEECIFKGVRKLPPAHYLVFNGKGCTITRYWDLDYRSKLDITTEEAIVQIDDLVDSAVAEQLMADVPVGVFLSGGVDSGYVSALSAKHKSGITSITMTVPGSKERDESLNARKIAERHSLHSIEVPLGEDCIRELPGLLSTTEPFGDSSIIPAAAVSREAVKYLKVVLTGDGGDEGFGGYGLPQIAYRAGQMQNGLRGRLSRRAAAFLKYFARQRVRPIVRSLRLHCSGAELIAGAGMEAFLGARDATPMQVRKLIYGPALEGIYDRPFGEHLIASLNDSLHKEWWEAMLSIGIKTRLVDDFLYKVDTATMFYSLESRAPFLDNRLHEFLAQLPFKVLMPDAEYKSLLKRVAVRYNPREVVYSKKKGFSIPVEQYFLKGWGKLLVELTHDGVAAQLGLINPKGVIKYLKKHGLRANCRLDRQLFSILALEIWLRVFYEKSSTAEELGERLLQGING